MLNNKNSNKKHSKHLQETTYPYQKNTQNALIQKLFDITSNNSSSQKKTTHTDASFIKCKKINNKDVNLQTQPHSYKIQDVQEKYISERNKDKHFERQTFASTINHTNRKSKNHQHIATQVFNNTGKYSNKTEYKCKQLDDIIALQSKTTTRKTKNSHSNIVPHPTHSKAPSLSLKSPKKKSKQKTKLTKSSRKYSNVKPILIAPIISQKKVKISKPKLHIQLQNIQKRVLEQVLELSNFSYGQYSISQPDLYHRVVQSQQVSIEFNSKSKAASIIKKYWVQYKQKKVLEHYQTLFSKKASEFSPFNSSRSQKKQVRKVPAFDLNDFERGFKQQTISQHIDDQQMQFNVNKYVNVETNSKQQQDIDKIKKKNKKLQKQLQKFKEKQFNLCQKFQNILLNSSDIKAQQLLQIIKMYKIQASFDKKSSTSSVSYKELIEQNGIAYKLNNSKNTLTKLIMDQQGLLKHKLSSKSLIQNNSSYLFNIQQHKQPTLIPPQQNSQKSNNNNVQTNKLLSTYLDCELQNFDYQKEAIQKISESITESINNQIEDFNIQQKVQSQTSNISEIMYDLAKTEQFQWAIISTLIEQFCEDAISSQSIIQNLTYIKELQHFNKGLQTKVSLPDIIDYLKGLIEHVLKNRKKIMMLLDNINKPLGSSSLELLYYLRPNADENGSFYNGQNPYNFVIPMGLFEQFQNIGRSMDGCQSQEGILINYFWHRSLYELFNQLLDKKRPFGIQGKPYAWNTNLNQKQPPISLQKLTKIFEVTLNQILQILTYPTGLMFDSPLCQYYQCELIYEDRIKINHDRMELMICQWIIEEESNYHNFNDEEAEVALTLAEYIQDLILFQAVVEYRKLSRQRFLLSI